MKIGIDGSRAFLKNRTGIEEYSYRVIEHLKKYLQEQQVILYVRANQKTLVKSHQWPKNWKIKIIHFPRFWTQIGLSLEMLFHPVDVLFIPAHTVPIIHSKKTVVVVHGLEYEFCPKAYSLWEKIYMRLSIKFSCKWGSKIISVSQNTKKDLIDLYKAPENKIKVIYEGYDCHQSSVISNQDNILRKGDDRLLVADEKYLLFIGRIEDRKNIINVVKAFDLLKENHNIEHKLVLAGRPGYGYAEIKNAIENSKNKNDIVQLGYISEEEKWQFLKNADVFVFPTKYEGFGIPILEAQSVGCPVVCSNCSSIPEVAQNSALLIDPAQYEDIAENIYTLVSDEIRRNAIINKGLENVRRFSWDKCAKEVASLLKV